MKTHTKHHITTTLAALAAVLLTACTTTAQVPPPNSVELKQRDPAGAGWDFVNLTPQPASALTFDADRKPATTLLSTFASAGDLSTLQNQLANYLPLTGGAITGNIWMAPNANLQFETLDHNAAPTYILTFKNNNGQQGLAYSAPTEVAIDLGNSGLVSTSAWQSGSAALQTQINNVHVGFPITGVGVAITNTTSGDINITAENDFNIAAKNVVNIDTPEDINVRGSSININADDNISLVSAGSFDLTANLGNSFIIHSDNISVGQENSSNVEMRGKWVDLNGRYLDINGDTYGDLGETRIHNLVDATQPAEPVTLRQLLAITSTLGGGGALHFPITGTRIPDSQIADDDDNMWLRIYSGANDTLLLDGAGIMLGHNENVSIHGYNGNTTTFDFNNSVGMNFSEDASFGFDGVFLISSNTANVLADTNIKAPDSISLSVAASCYNTLYIGDGVINIAAGGGCPDDTNISGTLILSSAYNSSNDIASSIVLTSAANENNEDRSSSVTFRTSDQGEMPSYLNLTTDASGNQAEAWQRITISSSTNPDYAGYGTPSICFVVGSTTLAITGSGVYINGVGPK